MGPGQHHLEGTPAELVGELSQAVEGDRRVEGRRRRAHWGFVAAGAALLLLPAAVTLAQGQGLQGIPLWLGVTGLFLVLLWFLTRQVVHYGEADIHDVDERFLETARQLLRDLAPRLQGPVSVDLQLVDPPVGETPWLRIRGRLKLGAEIALTVTRERQRTGRKIERRTASGETRKLPEERHREFIEIELSPWEMAPPGESPPPAGLALEHGKVEEGKVRLRLTGGTRICAENERGGLDFQSAARSSEALSWGLESLGAGG